ncbi:MAG: pyridoxine 5'-phosphate synthase [Lentimicrobiaceae bacterium]|nr:pyridoxine 5'-phosphate synthase [Lentimicrobiaceae bacterium]
MTRLSVNINKVATIRNARGGNVPDVLKVAMDCELFGAQGITVHPRPDERHIRYADVRALKPLVTTEFNIEGNPQPEFIKLVLEVKPHQVTLVPDAPDALTSNQGWDTIKHASFLKQVIAEFHQHGIRTSIFVDPIPEMARAAADTGTDRVELYTESYATRFFNNPEEAIAPFVETARAAYAAGLGINAGHDLSLDNLTYFVKHIPNLLEVSIGHALISEALYLGLQETIRRYLQALQ